MQLCTQQAAEEEFARQNRKKFQAKLLQRGGDDSTAEDDAIYQSIRVEQQRVEQKQRVADAAAEVLRRREEEAAERERKAALEIQQRYGLENEVCACLIDVLALNYSIFGFVSLLAFVEGGSDVVPLCSIAQRRREGAPATYGGSGAETM